MSQFKRLLRSEAGLPNHPQMHSLAHEPSSRASSNLRSSAHEPGANVFAGSGAQLTGQFKRHQRLASQSQMQSWTRSPVHKPVQTRELGSRASRYGFPWLMSQAPEPVQISKNRLTSQTHEPSSRASLNAFSGNICSKSPVNPRSRLWSQNPWKSFMAECAKNEPL